MGKFVKWISNNWGPLFILACMIAAVLIGACGPSWAQGFLWEMKP